MVFCSINVDVQMESLVIAFVVNTLGRAKIYRVESKLKVLVNLKNSDKSTEKATRYYSSSLQNRVKEKNTHYWGFFK